MTVNHGSATVHDGVGERRFEISMTLRSATALIRSTHRNIPFVRGQFALCV